LDNETSIWTGNLMQNPKMLLFFFYLQQRLRKTDFNVWPSLSYLQISQNFLVDPPNKFWTFFL